MIERVRAWAQHAERAHHAGKHRESLVGELWLLFAEVQGAYDACPDHVARVETRRESH